MKNYPLKRNPNLLRDYQKTKTVIEHPDNKQQHIDSLMRLCDAFYNLHGSSEYYKALYKSVWELEEKFFDERIEKLKTK